jgi:hypothetical protein
LTILVRIKAPGCDLTVCGTPSKEWLDWLLTAEVPLTDDQKHWRDLHAVATGHRAGGPRVWPPPGVPGRS